MSDALRQKGLAAARCGQFREAVNALSRYLTTGPEDDAEARVALALALSGVGQHDKALFILDRLVGRQPNSAALHYNRGVILEKLGQAHEAVTAFENAARHNPGHAKACARLTALGRPIPLRSDDVIKVEPEDDAILEVEAVAPVDDPEFQVPLDEGEGDDRCIAREVSGDRLVFSGNVVWDTLYTLFGSVALAAAVFLTVTYVGLVRDRGFQFEDGRPLSFTLLLFVWGVVGLKSVPRFGRRVIIDRDADLIENRLLFGLIVQRYAITDCTEVRFQIGADAKKKVEPCWVRFRGHGKSLFELGPVFAAKASADFYVRVGARAANVIRVPFRIVGRPTQPHADLVRWLDGIGLDGVFRSLVRRPRHKVRRVSSPYVPLALMAIAILTALISAMRYPGYVFSLVLGTQILGALLIAGGCKSIETWWRARLGNDASTADIVRGLFMVIPGLLFFVLIPLLLMSGRGNTADRGTPAMPPPRIGGRR
jgi:tetratricopeptide (TPR) repeat protein